MDNAVPVALEVVAHTVGRLGSGAANTCSTAHAEGSWRRPTLGPWDLTPCVRRGVGQPGYSWSVGEDVGANHPEDALIRALVLVLDGWEIRRGSSGLQCARGERKRVAGRRAALLAQEAPVVGSEVQRLRSRVEVHPTGQADVKLCA